jgi:DNA-3-methyladenine glycosylase I
MEKVRCRWAVEHPELIDYHDQSWSQPTHSDQEIFAAYGQCVLHAGLNWVAMLKKREVFAKAFDDWDINKVAGYGDDDITRLMTRGPMRNFQKINAIINNAKCIQEIQNQSGSFAAYLWKFVNDEPIICDHKSNPATKAQMALAEDLQQRGFKFSGPATVLGLMQDIGMVDEHDESCFVRTQR